MNQTQIRNFAIIAHIDAGKSTLSDRLMELTDTVELLGDQQQILDTNPIERERGVTIKLAPVTMNYQLLTTNYQLNLIDTPGHMDFSYEVDRSLAACEGAILLIDGSRGLQAQTFSHAQKALSRRLTLIPAINKIDLKTHKINSSLVQLNEIFGFSKERVSLISAKTGQGIAGLLLRIVKEIPPPQGIPTAIPRALIFNSVYDDHLGAIAFIRLVDGVIHSNKPLQTVRSETSINPKEIGIFTPRRQPTAKLTTGQVGYIATGFKDIRKVKIGDTITSSPAALHQPPTTPLPGYQEPQPLVFADLYPTAGTNYHQLTEAVDKLRLSDSSLTTTPVHSLVLGPGLRLGFLGLFHIEITKERLRREYQVETTFTSPTVSYRVTLTSGATIPLKTPHQLPDQSQIKTIKEPVTQVNLLTPSQYLGALMQLMEDHRALYLDTQYLAESETGQGAARLIYRLPLIELIGGLIDKIKSASQGYATLDYQPAGYQPVDAVKLTILINHQPVETLSRLVVRRQAQAVGRSMVNRLQKLLPPQLFPVPIQAAVGGKIIARQTKKAVRKDVTAKLYGGDQTRKDKLLKKQKKGKKRLAKFGQLRIPETVLSKMAAVS